MRLRTSLFLLALAVVTPLVLFCALAAWLLIHGENQSLVDTALARNRATLAAVDTRILGAFNTLRALSASASLRREDWQTFHADANAVLATQPAWQNITLSRPDGSQLVNARLSLNAALPQ